ncbi:hypothetical protein P8452_58461 [Trifolium repens]|nr:hypothetical protein P8452_58461 [Trifolium repens]
MSLCYQSQTLLGCVSILNPNNLNATRYLCKSRSLKVLSTPPSSVLLNADESGKFSKKFDSSKNHVDSVRNDSDSVTPFGYQGTTVGIIGGMSVDATLNFLRKLVELSSQDEQKPTPFLLCSDPILNKELLSYERSLESFKLDSSQIVQSLRNKRVFLENSGARCIVMPCNVSHSWYEQVSIGCSVPFLHMADCVAKELKEAKLKPLEAGSPLRIGVLATNATLAAGFYKEKLQNEGFEVILPDRATMEHTVIPAIEALSRKDMEGACNLLRIALQVLLVRAVNFVILASDEMRDVLPHDDPLLKKCIDPMDALARSTIKWVRSSGDNT